MNDNSGVFPDLCSHSPQHSGERLLRKKYNWLTIISWSLCLISKLNHALLLNAEAINAKAHDITHL